MNYKYFAEAAEAENHQPGQEEDDKCALEKRFKEEKSIVKGVQTNPNAMCRCAKCRKHIAA